MRQPQHFHGIPTNVSDILVLKKLLKIGTMLDRTSDAVKQRKHPEKCPYLSYQWVKPQFLMVQSPFPLGLCRNLRCTSSSKIHLRASGDSQLHAVQQAEESWEIQGEGGWEKMGGLLVNWSSHMEISRMS